MFGRAGYDVVTKAHRHRIGSDSPPERLRSRPPFFFIQVGAQDGLTGGPIHALVAAGSWTGVLIEPRRSMFERLRAAYTASRGLRFVNCAIAPVPGDRTLYALDDGDRTLPPWAHGLGTFDRNILLRHENDLPDLRSRIVTELVPYVGGSSRRGAACQDRLAPNRRRGTTSSSGRFPWRV